MSEHETAYGFMKGREFVTRRSRSSNIRRAASARSSRTP
jgi:hypothetical protein